MPVPAKVVVEHVARNEPGSDAAGDGLQLAVADESANLVLGAAELGSNLADGQGCGPVHAGSIAADSPAQALALNSFHCPSETTSTVPSTTLIAV